MSTDSVSISIPAYRNPARLRRCLESIARVDPDWLTRTIVVDDSGDGQVARALTPSFPQVRWIAHETNRGFAAAANFAVLSCRTDYALLLNDDSELSSDPRESVLRHFADENVFAVSLKSVNELGQLREGAKRISWRFGIAKVLHNVSDQRQPVNGVQYSDYAVGGHAAYRVSSFRELGGFDSTFHPFYWEDADLSARARLKGWRTVYADDAQVIHRYDGAIRSTQSETAIRVATCRNRLTYSRRHARGLQYILQPVGLAWISLQSVLKSDIEIQQAIAEFRQKSRKNSKR